MEKKKSIIPDLVKEREPDILREWLKEQDVAATLRLDIISEEQLADESRAFLNLLQKALNSKESSGFKGAAWDEVMKFISVTSASRAKKGFTPSETATFIFSLKQPLMRRLREEISHDSDRFLDELWSLTALIDRLGLHAIESFQRSREEVIRRQSMELLELSTPVVKLWEGILALPLIGTLDSNRTQVVMESLLNSIVETGSTIAIIDITGVPTVDTLVAQHLLKTVSASRLMGAECIISGIRPQIALTMVQLGVRFEDIVTKATLADAIAFAFERHKLVVINTRKEPQGGR